jgi:hypothetical protein
MDRRYRRTPQHSPFDFAPATAGKQGRLIGSCRTGTNASTQRDGYRTCTNASCCPGLYVIHV